MSKLTEILNSMKSMKLTNTQLEFSIMLKDIACLNFTMNTNTNNNT